MSIKVKNLEHTYDPGTPYELKALKAINLSIESGELIGLIGHTGSGKSTLIQHLNGLLRPTSGQLEVGDYMITQEKKNLLKLRHQVGLVFQYPEYQLFEETVYADIAFGPKNVGKSPEEIDGLVKAAMASVGLDFEVFKDKAPFELSGGQKRKVAIAGVLAMDPKILVLDEPTAGLDPKSREDLLKHIKRLHKDKGMTIIYVTHSMEEVARLVDRVIVMHQGTVMFDDKPTQVFKHVEALQAIGLDVPQMSKLVHMLNRSGFSIPEDIMTLEGLQTYLLEELRSSHA